MLSSKEIFVPENLINLAEKTPFIPACIVCAHYEPILKSSKLAYDLNLIQPIFIGKKELILKISKKIGWDLSEFEIIDISNDLDSAAAGVKLASQEKVKIIIKGNIHTDLLMGTYVKKDFNLIGSNRLSHIWHMTLNKNDKPLIITDGVLNVSPRVDIKMHILKNAVKFMNKIGINKPRVAILSATEDPIKSIPSSIEAKEVMEKAIEQKIDAFVQGPLAFDNAISPKAASIKKISGEVAGKADVLLVPNIETGNTLAKTLVHFLGACAAGTIVGSKVPVVIPSRSDSVESMLASIAAANISTE
tara:strand:+ start:791 stop:1702 length:912 start_codon:yes stop_codon:yes gene_type:complete